MGNEVDASRDPRLRNRSTSNAATAARRRSRFLSTSSLLEQDGFEKVEYIRGVGQVKTHARLADDDDGDDLEPLHSSTFQIIESICPCSNTPEASCSWVRELDQFVLKDKRESLVISATDLKRVTYCETPPVFNLTVRSIAIGQQEFFLQLKNSSSLHGFRVALARRIVATAIDRTSHEIILKKIAELKKQWNHEHGDKLQQRYTIYKSSAPRLQQTHTVVFAERPLRTALENADPARSTVLRASPPLSAYYDLSSGSIIRVGDLALRIRDPADEQSAFKLDEEDIWDGPFRVVELPAKRRSSLWTSRSTQADDEATDVRHGEDYKEPNPASERDLVKLEIPSDRRGRALNPWTPLWRIRRAYVIPPPNSTNEEAPEALFSRLVMEDSEGARTPADLGHEDTFVIARLYDRIIVKAPYANPYNGDGECYEVDKLRGKRIACMELESLPDDFPAHGSDHPVIHKFFAEGGKLPPGQVLVLQYLVHWAGWGSEDDTWEIAEQNLPPELIDQFEAYSGHRIEVQVPGSLQRVMRKQRTSDHLGMLSKFTV